MSKNHDRDLGMLREITRRDFLNGVALTVGGSLLPRGTLADVGRRSRYASPQESYYPPAATGMRGSHPGSFEVAHGFRDGRTWTGVDSGERYDMVVVGGGLSGLSAGFFFRETAGPSSRVLILDNHDDFGGHAKRNEFSYGGRTLMLNGGTSNLEATKHYSTVARTLLSAVGLDLERALTAEDTSRDFYASLGLTGSTFFSREVFGADRLVTGSARGFGPGAANSGWEAWLAQTPLSREAQAQITRLEEAGAQPDGWTELSDDERKARLARMSYQTFLVEHARVGAEVLAYYDDRPKGLFCVGIDALPALYAWAMNYPGFQQLDLRPFPRVGPLTHIGGGQHGRERQFDGGPTIELPDGNATLARLLVRGMIPDALPGSTLEDSIMSRLDYSRLDRSGSSVRIRLNSTVVQVRHRGSPERSSEVDVTYVGPDGSARTVRAAHVIMACQNDIIPYICPEMPAEQREALDYGERMPIVYTNVLIRDWTSFADLGIRSVNSPGMYHSNFNLGRAIDIGGYDPPRSPDDPMVLHMTRTPCAPGLPKKEQHRRGRQDLLDTSFEAFERNIRDQLGRALSDGGFDPARDIAAITVNRWPHGYAYSYDTLDDPIEWSLFEADDRPCVIGSRRFGRISIANSDAAATPHTDAAIDEGYRAVGEQLVVRSRAAGADAV
ncbi:MAG: NAD(P)-binding protein [Gemmatimonadota bacterium]|nr:NAD(P)-binding protein [Gemmatimonadota bacterium]MDH3422610.1 NAD(P)-binding protein [Gemmatimonadota bacterium]